MELQVKHKDGTVIGTVELPLEAFEQRLKETEGAVASLGSGNSSVSEEALAQFAEKTGEVLAPFADRIEAVEAQLKSAGPTETARLVERVFQEMGQESYLAEGVKLGYITAEESPGQGDDETAVLFSPNDHSGDPGWEYSETLKMWVHVGEKK